MRRGRRSFSTERYAAAITIALLLAAPLLADLASIRNSIRNGDLTGAVAECDRELKTAPRSFALHTMKGLALQAAGDRPAALASFRRALDIDPAYPPALQAAAQIEFENRDPNARSRLESVLRVSPSSEPAHAMLGELLFENRSCQPAVAHFEKAPESLQSPSIRWQYGVCLLERQRWPDAAKQFAALLQLREHAPTRYNLALAYWNAHEYSAAAAALLPLQSHGPDADVLRLLASALEASGDTPQAYSVLQRAIQENPRDERLLIDLAVMCMDHQALKLGLEVVQAGIRTAPASARLQTLLGVLLVRSGDPDKGKESFRRAQQLDPQLALGRIGLASLLMQMGLAGDAAALLREQLAANGRDPRTELTLVRALLLKSPSQEEKREAGALLHGIVKDEPGNAAAHGLLGKVYFLSGEMPKAAAELETAIRLDPSDRSSTYQLMTIFQRTGRARESAALARKVQSLLEKEKAEETSRSRFQIVWDRQ